MKKFEYFNLKTYYEDIKSGTVTLTYQDFKKRAFVSDVLRNFQNGHILKAIVWGIQLIFTAKSAFNKFKNAIEECN